MSEEIFDKITNLEKLIIEIKNTLLYSNQELINQNVKLSNMVYGSNISNFHFTPEPPPPSPQENNTNGDTPENNENVKVKNLFYKENNEKTELYIYGSGTFDNKEKIRNSGGEWNPSKKMWVIKLTENFDEKINEIIEKLNLKIESVK